MSAKGANEYMQVGTGNLYGTATLTWAERLHEAIVSQQSILCVGLDPIYEKMPSRHKTGDVAGDIFMYNKAIIDGVAPFAAAFKPQYKCYSAEGEAGIAALRRTCAYIKENYPHIPVILDAKYADIGHVLERCAHEAFDMLGVDAVTAMPNSGRQALAPLISRHGKGCFLVVRTSNPGAGEIQDMEVAGGEPLYVAVTHKVIEGWNEAGSIGLVAPATDPAVLARVREAAPYMPILCPGVGAQGGDLEAAVEAGLDANGAGLLINVSRAIMEAPDPGRAAREWRDLLEQARLGRSEVPGAKRSTLLEDVVVEMFKVGAIQFKPVTLKSGLVSPYYNNLRLLSSYPTLLRKVAALMSSKLVDDGVKPDIVIGIAMAGIPLATALSQYSGIPGGYVRSEAKAHGTKQMVEGAWPDGASAVLVDDVVSDGASKLEVIGHLRDAGLEASDIIVLVDRGQGGPALMARHGLRCHAVATMDQVLDILLERGLINQSQVDDSRRFMADAQAQS